MEGDPDREAQKHTDPDPQHCIYPLNNPYSKNFCYLQRAVGDQQVQAERADKRRVCGHSRLGSQGGER